MFCVKVVVLRLVLRDWVWLFGLGFGGLVVFDDLDRSRFLRTRLRF